MIDQFVEFLGVAFAAIFQPLLQKILRDTAHLNELFDDRLAKGVEVVRIAHVLKAVSKTALKKELRHLVQQFFQAEPVQRRGNPL